MKTQSQNKAGLNFQRPAEASGLSERVCGNSTSSGEAGQLLTDELQVDLEDLCARLPGSGVTNPSPVRGEAPVAELGSSAMEKTEGKC